LAAGANRARLCAAFHEGFVLHIAGLGLHVLIAICFAVHVIRSGQDRYWLFILFMFPLLGSLVYALAIWLPALRSNPQAHRLMGHVRKVLDPGRELREAQDAFDLSASADNRLRLANALLETGDARAAADHFRAAMRSVHSDDPHIHVRLAHALLEAGEPQQARDELDALRRAHPNLRSPEGHLTYARAVAGCGDEAQAREEFEQLITYYAGFEPRARYAELLLRWGDRPAAHALAEQSLKAIKRLPKYSRQMNREWVTRIEAVANSAAPDVR
jgi:hypothetical protein